MIAPGYVLRMVLAYTGVALAALLTVYLTFDLVETFRFLDAQGGGLPLTLRYLYDRLPSALWHVLPAVVLAGTTLALSTLARRGEITALFAAGIGPGRLLTPVLLVAAGATAVGWSASDHWMPEANRRIYRLLRTAVEGESAVPAGTRNHWLRTGSRFVQIGTLGPGIDEAQAVTVFEVGADTRPVRRIDAARMRWRGGRWILEEVTERGLRPYALPVRRGEAPAGLEVPPDRLRAGASGADLLETAEIAGVIDWKRREGQDTAALEGALAERWSWTLLPFWFGAVAAALGLARRRAGGIVAALGRVLAVGAAFGALAFSVQALGRAGLLSPAIAGWLPMALLAAAALGLCTHLLWPRRP